VSELADMRASVAARHEYLPRYGLVTWTAGNVSERVPGEDDARSDRHLPEVSAVVHTHSAYGTAWSARPNPSHACSR
jgi:L-ribulose-5-phosphate 4-epimerase